jgi:hypothetical protein
MLACQEKRSADVDSSSENLSSDAVGLKGLGVTEEMMDQIGSFQKIPQEICVAILQYLGTEGTSSFYQLAAKGFRNSCRSAESFLYMPLFSYHGSCEGLSAPPSHDTESDSSLCFA